MELTIRAAAAHLDVKPDTLRKWERRLGLSGPRRGAGRPRRYGRADLRRLHRFVRRRRLGGSAALAARLAGLEPSARDAAARRSRAEAWNAARRFDSAELERVHARATARGGLAEAWEKVWAPLLEERAEKDHGAGDPSGAERFLRFFLRQALERPQNAPSRGRPARPRIVLAALEGDPAGLDLSLWRARLEERGWMCLCLGADFPAQDLPEAVARSGARRLCLVATRERPRAEWRKSLAALRRRLPGTALYLAGPATLSPAAVIPRWGASFLGVDFETAWDKLSREERPSSDLARRDPRPR
jgi:DNA-binding transcriptional MerR regulator